jgi:hypothetical protein
MPFSITISQPSSAPAWFTSLPYSQWQLVGSNSMGSVSSINNYGLTDVWIGAAVDEDAKKFVIGAPGGHQDPGENSVFEFRLNQATPAWYRTRAGNNPSVTQGSNQAGYDGSGQPTSTHSYHNPVCAQGRFWLPILGAYSGQVGHATTSVFSYDLAQTSGGVWNRHGRQITGSITGGWIGGASTYDPVTDRIFSFAQGGWGGVGGVYFNASNVIAAGNIDYPNATPGATTVAGLSSGDYCLAVTANELRRIISITANPVVVRSLQLDNIGAGWTTHSVSAAPFSAYYGGGAVYHEGTRRLYSYNSVGNTIRVFDIPTNITSQWPRRTVTLGGLTAPGTQNSQGFSRFNLVQNMGNGEACLLWYPRYNVTGMYVCRIPPGGL